MPTLLRTRKVTRLRPQTWTATAVCATLLILGACSTSDVDVARDRAPAAAAADGAFDIVITNGHLVDGTGNAWFAADLGIRGDRIARIAPVGMLAKATAATRIDAGGKVVSPGFIDIQGQSAIGFTVGDGRDASKVSQGITTEILGEGSTPAPVNETILRLTAGQLRTHDDSVQAKAFGAFGGAHGFGAWLTAMEKHGVSVNVGSFIGAGTVRVYTKGYAAGAPTAAELDTMRTVTRNAMLDGAFGVASALIYPPGNYATTGELVEMAKAMSPFGGVYITHMRSEADGYLEAIDEALRIGREGGVPVEIYHLKAGGVRNWSKAPLAVAKIDSARAAGQDIAADMYPYVAGGTSLSACTPPWATEGDKLLERLRDPATRAKIVAEMQLPHNTWENLCSLATPSGVMTVGYDKPEWKKYEGKRVAEIATMMRKDWANTVVEILLGTDARVGMLVFMMSEPNVEMQMRQPWMKFGTDAEGQDPDSAKGLTHPRSYGTFPRILGHYVRDRRVMPLEEAVRKMTSAVANRLSIRDRGQLREGFFADVVIFDPATVIDRATYTAPHQHSIGIQTVIVNGVRVWENGKHTGAKPGRIVRGPGWSGVRSAQ